MWAYRIDHDYDFEAWTIELGGEGLTKAQLLMHGTTIREGLELLKHIDWDGTSRNPPRGFFVPGLHRMGLGVIVQDVGGRVFIASPVAMPHITKALDWDAHVSHDEIAHTRALVLDGQESSLPAPRLKDGWRITGRGNFAGTINGVNVTVYKRGDRWTAIMNPIKRPPVSTKAFITSQDCCDYVLKNFYDIIDPPDEFGGPLTSADDWDD